MAGSLSSRATLFISQLILARLLTPADFGVVGLATSITAIFTVLGNVGVEQVLQQRRARMRLWTTQAFWISLVLACIAAAAMSAFAPVGARLYHNGQIPPLIWITATSLPLAALSTVPRAYLQAAMRFRFLSSYAIAELVASQSLMVLLAWQHFGAVSFVLPVPFLALVRAAVFWRAVPVRFAFLRSCRRWRVMLLRGSAILASQMYSVLVDQGDYIVLGLFAPAQVVGVYFFAFKLAAQPMRMIAGNVSAVLFPALNAFGDERTRQRDAALKSAELLGIITVPVCFMQAAIAGPALALLFGDRWSESVPLLQVLSLGLPFDAISWAAGSFLSVRGRFARMFLYQAVFTPLFYALVVAGAVLGSAIGVAIAVACYAVIHPMAFSVLVFALEGIGIQHILVSYLGPMLLGAVAIGGAYELTELSVPADAPVARIAAVVMLGGLAYVIGVRQFLPECYRTARTILLGYRSGANMPRRRG